MVDNLKLVLVGDTGVGKSSLAFTYGSGTFPAGFRPCFNGINNKHDMMLGDDTLVTIEIVIAPSSDGFNEARRTVYSVASAIIICHAINNRRSYSNVSEKWYPELRSHFPDIPVILVGTKLDLREDGEQAMGQELLTMAEGFRLQSSLCNGAIKYMECSALTGLGVKNVFMETATVAALHFRSSNRRKCMIS